MTRTDPPQSGDEAATLVGFLNFHRDTLRLKTDGLSQEQLGRTLAPSSLTLAGLLKHLAVVESSWLSEDFEGGPLMPPFDTVPWDDDPDWEHHSALQDSPEQLRAIFDESTGRSDEIIARALAADDGLDALTAKPGRNGEPFSLRWVLVHLIEEYARHNGHADFLRESIDGSTGE